MIDVASKGIDWLLDEVERILLDRQMNEIAHQLALKSVVSAAGIAGGEANSHPGSKPPPDAWKPDKGHSELHRLLYRYEGAMSNTGRQKVIEEAEAELKTWVRKEAPESEGVSFEQVIIDDAEGYAPEMVAERYGLSVHHVRRIRARHDRHQTDGTPLKTKKVEETTEKIDIAARRKEVDRMKKGGMSNRQIAFVLGCDEGTVRKDWLALSS